VQGSGSPRRALLTPLLSLHHFTFFLFFFLKSFSFFSWRCKNLFDFAGGCPGAERCPGPGVSLLLRDRRTPFPVKKGLWSRDDPVPGCWRDLGAFPRDGGGIATRDAALHLLRGGGPDSGQWVPFGARVKVMGPGEEDLGDWGHRPMPSSPAHPQPCRPSPPPPRPAGQLNPPMAITPHANPRARQDFPRLPIPGVSGLLRVSPHPPAIRAKDAAGVSPSQLGSVRRSKQPPQPR